MKFFKRFYFVILTLLIVAAITIKIAAYYEREELKNCPCHDKTEELDKTLEDLLDKY